MKKILLAGLATGLGLIAFAGSAYALSVNYVPGTTNTTSAITTHVTTGEDMAGMKVTALFSDGSSEAATWVSNGNGTGTGIAAVTNSWSLKESGNSFYDNWTFSGPNNIKNITIDAGTGNTVFDVWGYSQGTGTSNSGFGQAITLKSATPWNISATYSGLVALSGASPVGDLYRYLSIDFSNFTSTNTSGTFSFLADTDTTAGNINPVPEPATMLLLGTGLAGIAGTMRRRKKNV